MPHFAINIALRRETQIVAGVTYNPANADLFWTERGRGAFMGDRRLRVAARRSLDEAVIATGIPFMGHGQHGLFLKELHQISQRVSGVRRFGAAALDWPGSRPEGSMVSGSGTSTPGTSPPAC